MTHITTGERHARLATRHLLAPSTRVADVAGVARALVGIHSSDAASVFIGATARMQVADSAAVERSLYEDRTVVRMLGMRRTMFVEPVELAPVVHAASTRALIDGERRRFVRMVEDAGITSTGDRWLRRIEQATLDAIEARGEATARQLAEDVPDLREQIAFGEGKRWAGKVGVSTRVLFLLATEGLVVRARPLGAWTSTQYRWAPMAAWVPGGIDTLSTDDACLGLARRWLGAYGPGTAADLQWWTGWTGRQTKRALAAIGAAEVELDGGVAAAALPDDLEPVPSPEPWLALLPALDSTVMGWKERGWFLGDHRAVLFDRNGNAGPTVWWNGRVVGGWAQRPDGEIAFRLLDDLGADVTSAVNTAAAGLAAWLGHVRVTPRFRTPLEQELSS
ncbi:MAG TPA: winged helix DNA-binding domain-containing protein [Acidimicrobiia bacterium]